MWPRRSGLVKDLQIHQLELELQNQTLLEMRQQLEQSLKRYTDLYPIASGVIEGACHHGVKDRMERTGMHWKPCPASKPC